MDFKSNHILIGSVVILGLVVLFLMFKKKPIHNEGVVKTASAPVRADVNSVIDKLQADENAVHPLDPAVQPVSAETMNKFLWKNAAGGSKYKKSSYAEGERGNTGIDEWDNFYNSNTDLIDKSYIQNNDAFLPVDESLGNLANYDGKGHVKLPAEDLLNSDNLLPQEVNKDWFEVMPEALPIKSRNLINVSRPIGVNSIGATSKKNASWDLRGDIANPRMKVSVWNQSSITPNLLTKGLCNY